VRSRLVVACCVAALALVLPTAPVDAGGARFIQVEKVVTGPGSPGPFSIEVSCDVTAGETFVLSDGELDVIQIQFAQSEFCTVTELDAMGAEVSYECEPTGQGDDAAVCESGNEVSWEGDLTGAAVIVVTNAYSPPTTSTTTTTVPADQSPTATPRPASPTFTG
jgi:hypothetical protein